MMSNLYCAQVSCHLMDVIRIPNEPVKTVHGRYPGKRLKMNDARMIGRINAVIWYFLKILMVWIKRWVLVRPKMAFGFRLKASMSLSLNRPGMLA